MYLLLLCLEGLSAWIIVIATLYFHQHPCAQVYVQHRNKSGLLRIDSSGSSGNLLLVAGTGYYLAYTSRLSFVLCHPHDTLVYTLGDSSEVVEYERNPSDGDL